MPKTLLDTLKWILQYKLYQVNRTLKKHLLYLRTEPITNLNLIVCSYGKLRLLKCLLSVVKVVIFGLVAK